MTLEEQLRKWAAGESIHNNEDGICCPDFSCCNKDIFTAYSQRKKFLKAFLERDCNTIARMSDEFVWFAISAINPNTGVCKNEKH